jgi:transposase
LANTATVSYKWGKKGIQPTIEQVQRKRERKTIFGCVEPATGIVTASHELKGNTLSFFCFLLKVIKAYPERKVVMVLDNVRYHHAKRLKPILERYKHKIELCYLPAYSPDINPMERIWWYMRKKITHNRHVQNMETRISNFEQFIQDFKEPNQIGKSLSNLIVNL